MKRLIFSLLFFLLVFNSFAQDKVANYIMSYFAEDGLCTIEASKPKNDDFKFYINAVSKDNISPIGFIIESEDVNDFITQLNNVKEKFVEWSQVAKDNNVTDFDKKFDWKFNSVDVYFKYGTDWHFTTTRLAPYFKVTKNGEMLVVFSNGKFTASDNRFMTAEGFMMAFCTVNEIEFFIEGLNIDKVLKAKKEEDDKSALFN